MSAASKRCIGCGETKAVGEFNRHRRASDGRQSTCRECRSASHAKNRETDNERSRAYREVNREAVQQWDRAHHAANPHKGWAGRYRRRALEYGFQPVVESFKRDDVVDRYGDACAHCGGAFEELDHYPVPVREGGHHTLDNVRPSCRRCNRKSAPVVAGLVSASPS